MFLFRKIKTMSLKKYNVYMSYHLHDWDRLKIIYDDLIKRKFAIYKHEIDSTNHDMDANQRAMQGSRRVILKLDILKIFPLDGESK